MCEGGKGQYFFLWIEKWGLLDYPKHKKFTKT
jgi:hypothetical protein